MNLLLLLSALMSALTGLSGGGQRAPVAVAQVVASAVAATADRAAGRADHRPVQVVNRVASRLASVALVQLPRFELPAYASRRRE